MVEFMYLVLTRMPGESYCRQFGLFVAAAADDDDHFYASLFILCSRAHLITLFVAYDCK